MVALHISIKNSDSVNKRQISYRKEGSVKQCNIHSVILNPFTSVFFPPILLKTLSNGVGAQQAYKPVTIDCSRQWEEKKTKQKTPKQAKQETLKPL